MFKRLVLLLALAPVVAVADPSPFLTATIDGSMSGTNYGGPFLRGTSAQITTRVQKCTTASCPLALERTSLYYRLPPGLELISYTPFNPVQAVCTAGPVEPGGQTIVCTGNGLSGNGLGINHYSGVNLIVQVAPSAPLGTGRITMAVDDSLPGESGTLALCQQDASPSYCDTLDRGIAPGPEPDLHLFDESHAPGVFLAGAQDARVQVYFQNRGNAPTQATHLYIALPPGFEWRPADTSGLGLSLACTPSGSVASGQVLTCSGGALQTPTAANNHLGRLTLGITPRPTMEQPGPLPVVFALGDGNTTGENLLLGCTDNPEQNHCAWLWVPTGTACGNRIVAHGIHCDGFEALALPD